MSGVEFGGRISDLGSDAVKPAAPALPPIQDTDPVEKASDKLAAGIAGRVNGITKASDALSSQEAIHVARLSQMLLALNATLEERRHARQERAGAKPETQPVITAESTRPRQTEVNSTCYTEM